MLYLDTNFDQLNKTDKKYVRPSYS